MFPYLYLKMCNTIILELLSFLLCRRRGIFFKIVSLTCIFFFFFNVIMKEFMSEICQNLIKSFCCRVLDYVNKKNPKTLCHIAKSVCLWI